MFAIELTHEYAVDDRQDERFECASVDEAAGRIDDLTSIGVETARDDLTSEEKLTYREDGRVVTVVRIGALV